MEKNNSFSMFHKKITFFITVVEHGSFSQAAKALYLSQSAISQQITQLENELGLKLFDRSYYRPELTPAGRYYYQECKKLLAQYHQIEKRLYQFNQTTEKTLHIGITGPLETKHVPFIIKRYKKYYPNIAIKLKKVKFEMGVWQLEKGILDVCFGIGNDFKNKEKISTLTLMPHQVCVICSKEHPWANRQTITGAELANAPIVALARNFGTLFYADFLQSFKEDGVTPHIVQEVNELEELLLAVKINVGIGLISKEVLNGYDDVCILDLVHTHHHADFCLGYLPENNPPYINNFIQTASTYFKQDYNKNL